MNILRLILGCAALCGCSREFDQKEAQKAALEAHVVLIDNCQYIASGTYAGSWVFSHKGNCTNCTINLNAIKVEVNR